MTTITVQKDEDWGKNGWTAVPNALISDKVLTPDAKWAFTWLARHTEKFTFNAEDLADAGPKGRNHARESLRELEEHGWLTRQKVKDPETGRVVGMAYRIHAVPVPPEQRTFVPSTAKKRKFPSLQKPSSEPAPAQSVAGQDPEAPAEENRWSAPATDQPGAGQPGAGQPGTGQSVAPYREEKTSREDQEELTTSEAAPPREDVEMLCRRLRDRMVANGCKPPTITKAWRDAARLLLDKDGRQLDKALNLIDWATQDEFWMANVQSMGKFRQQYDALRLRAVQDYRRKTGANRRSQTAVAMEAVDDAFARYQARLDGEARALEGAAR